MALLRSRAAKALEQASRITRLLVISFDRKDSGLSSRFSVVGNLLPRIGKRTVVHEVGSKKTGLDHRGVDSKRREFVVQGLCDSFHSKLGRAVYPPASRRPETAERGEIYDVARLLPLHRWKHGPDDIQQAENVGAVDAFDLFASGLFDSPKHAEAGVIHEDINPAEPTNAIANTRCHLRFVRHVHFDGEPAS